MLGVASLSLSSVVIVVVGPALILAIFGILLFRLARGLFRLVVRRPISADDGTGQPAIGASDPTTSLVRLVGGLTILADISAIVVAIAAHAPAAVVGVAFWVPLLIGWLVERFLLDRAT
jgi:hypothetical protein